MFCHIPGLVCQDRPPMNIFLEKKDDSIRLVVQSRVVGGRGSGDCRQRVTSGTILQPPAQSPILGGRCHHTSTIEQHPFLFIFFFFANMFRRDAPEDWIFRSRTERELRDFLSDRHLRFTILSFSHAMPQIESHTHD